MTDNERDRLLLSISTTLADIKAKLEQDYHALHGNGSPGLLEKVNNITTRLVTLETKDKERSHHYGVFAGIIGFIVNAALAIWAALKNQT
ncbi:MAG: hypothetical protein IJU70_06450 [Lentisphaeria bacterium]|nr:hypothetical protein [Lentisphaeria bacterium]